MIRNKPRNKRKKNNNKKVRSALQSRLTKTIMDKPTVRAVNTSVRVFAVNGQFYVGYSLSSSPSQVSPTFTFDIMSSLLASTEYVNLAKQYNFCKIRGVGVKITPSMGNNTDIASLPQIYVSVYGGGQNGSYTALSAFMSDNAVSFNPRATTNGLLTYYSLPGTIVGNQGYTIGGSNAWIATGSLTSSGVLNLLVGWNTNIAPQFISGAAYSAYAIAMLDVSIDCVFAGANISS